MRRANQPFGVTQTDTGTTTLPGAGLPTSTRSALTNSPVARLKDAHGLGIRPNDIFWMIERRRRAGSFVARPQIDQSVRGQFDGTLDERGLHLDLEPAIGRVALCELEHGQIVDRSRAS